MRNFISEGDLVTVPSNSTWRLGMIVSASAMNDKTYSTSEHTRNLLGMMPKVYYVFFPGLGISGPYFAGEVSLKQEYSVSR